MSGFSLSQAALWAGGRLLGPDAQVDAVATDTRSLQPGQLFVALVGPRFDGHEFTDAAQVGGAAGLLVDRQVACPLPQILVADTRLALGRLAAAWRARFPGRVVALTGSNGKTTTKEMIAAALAGAGRVAATRGNLNNDIGLPLTLLGARDEDYLVLELGANHPGEIAHLSAIARPHVALITNAGRAHLEGFGSLEGVARAKGEIIGGLIPEGVFVLNADDPWAGLWRELASGRRILSFGRGGDADVHLHAVEQAPGLNGAGFHARYLLATPRDTLALDLALPGGHNLTNALAAVAVAEALEIDLDGIASGLAGLRPVPGRMQPLRGIAGARLIDDSYNANPDSVRAALGVLGTLPGRRWLVLGDLAELGADASELHRDVGRQARLAGLSRLWAVGPLSRAAAEAFGDGGRHFPDQDSLTDALRGALEPQDVVLVKGSRSAAMDRVIRELVSEGED